MSKWNDEKDTVIRQAYRDRTRLAEVAERLGTTRNAIAGRAFKLGLSKPIRIVALEISQKSWRIEQHTEIGRKISENSREKREAAHD